ncbi:hypothetical protein HMI55_003634, partial [Coelomomyces lativittatus]
MKKGFLIQECSCILMTMLILSEFLLLDSVICEPLKLDAFLIEKALFDNEHKVGTTRLTSPTLKLDFISTLPDSNIPKVLTEFEKIFCSDLYLEFPTEAAETPLAKSITFDYYRNNIQLALYENFIPDYHYLGDLDGLEMNLKMSCGENELSGTVTFIVEESDWHQKLYTNDNPHVYKLFG